jgi:hypothetical protein
MAGKTPAQALQYYRSLSHPAIAAMPIVILDHLAPHIADLFNLSQIPWDHSPRNIKKLNETLAYYRKSRRQMISSNARIRLTRPVISNCSKYCGEARNIPRTDCGFCSQAMTMRCRTRGQSRHRVAVTSSTSIARYKTMAIQATPA